MLFVADRRCSSSWACATRSCSSPPAASSTCRRWCSSPRCGFVDLIIALKLLIVVVWVGAGVSKFGHHFSTVVAAHGQQHPVDARSRSSGATTAASPTTCGRRTLAGLLAHVGGTTVEIVLPLVLLFSTNPTVTLLAVVGMVFFHLFILSTFPIAVPLEWNVLFAFATVFLFWGHPAWDGLRRRRLLLAVAAARDRRRAAVLPGARQPASRPGLVPAVDAAVRRQLGLGHVGVRARRGGQARPTSTRPPATPSTRSRRPTRGRSPRCCSP